MHACTTMFGSQPLQIQIEKQQIYINQPIPIPFLRTPQDINKKMSKTCALASTLPLVSLLFCLQLATTFSDDVDVPILLEIKEQFGNPGGLSGWRPDTDHCNWAYVQCNSDRRVVGLFVGLADVNSTVPPAIGDLDQLGIIFFISLPGLHGPIPCSFAKLSHLRELNIVSTSISGPLPDCLSNITSLSSINLSDNKLTGRIPASLGKLPHLRTLILENNSLSGPIPPGLLHGGTAASPLRLTLSSNMLSGKIPQGYGRENFSVFFVQNNRLAGDASFMFGENQVAASIDLSRNRLRFDLTNVAVAKSVLLLNASRNEIHGRVPVSLRESSVMFLDLSYNQLCGEIPTGGRMSQFGAEAYGHNKCLCGTPLPPCGHGH